MIKVNYDKKIDAKYVSIKKGVVHETQRLEDWLLFDLNKKGEVLGVEILDASKNKVTLFTNGLNLIQCVTEKMTADALIQTDNFGVTFEEKHNIISSPKILITV